MARTQATSMLGLRPNVLFGLGSVRSRSLRREWFAGLRWLFHEVKGGDTALRDRDSHAATSAVSSAAPTTSATRTQSSTMFGQFGVSVAAAVGISLDEIPDGLVFCLRL